jgi:DNA polymerase family B
MKRREDYSLWEQVVLSADRENVAPGYRFGKYVHPTTPRSVLRKVQNGREHLSAMPLPKRGRHYEKLSDMADFVAWDGEGITYEQGLPQQYVLFGSSTDHMVQGHSLSTIDCLDTILSCEIDNPTAIHVGFAFKYDSEMILRDLPLRHWHILKRKSTVRFEGYTITYHPGRLFRVSRKEANGQIITATIYDVWGFFQASFVKALRTWLDDDELAEIDKIEAGKAERGHFTYDQVDSFIAPYWRTELRLLVILCNRLRERLAAADICPSQWHGAGALATYVYRKHNTRKHQTRTERDWHMKDKDILTVLPKEVNDAARHAYAGGRFELFKIGHVEQPVYQYDINSAYPSGISRLPSLRDAQWEHQISPSFTPSLFGVFRVEYRNRSHQSLHAPSPLFHRDWEGKVSYPAFVNGWYWTPEAALIANDPHAVITEAWICHHNGEYPFQWVREYYDERKRRKQSGDPSEKAYKLALNSLYGKMAQRLGYKEGEPLPRFHQLEWAGWVTSYTRANLYAAMVEAGSDLIAVETDAVFSLRKLDGLDCGTGLGQWEVTEHDWITYLQSGTYWSNHGAKYRGFDKDSLTHDDAMQWLRAADWSAPLVGTTTRFIGSGTGLGTPLHRCWVTDSRDMQPGKSGKRIHVAEMCVECADGQTPANTMHPLMCMASGGTSFPHALPWLHDGAPGVEWQEMYDTENWSTFDA